MVDAPPYCSNEKLSNQLARNIRQYWHKRGRYDVKVWVETDKLTPRKPLYVVRSNLVLKG